VGRASSPSPTPPTSSSPSPPEVGQASSLPSSPPPSQPPLSEPQQIDLILRLWERGEFALSDIAAALRIPMQALIKLLNRPDIAELLNQMGHLLNLRLRHIAAKAAPKALATLEQVQTEAAEAATSTPISPEAIKADRRSATARTQRRLAASAILTMHRSLKVALKVAPVSDRCMDNRITEPKHNDTGRRPVPPQEAIAA